MRRTFTTPTSAILAVAGVGPHVPGQRFRRRRSSPTIRACAADRGAGGPLAGMTDQQKEYFVAGKEEFEEAEEVAEGLGRG